MTLSNGHGNGTANGHSVTVSSSPNGNVQGPHQGIGFDLRGITPAPVTPFTPDGKVDFDAIQRLGSWLASVEGVKGLLVLGHAGEGTALTSDEKVELIKAFVRAVDDKIPIIAGITGEGNYIAGLEAKAAKEAGAKAGLLYPNHGWLRFGYQKGAPQLRYSEVYAASQLPLILFQYPASTKASYDLETQLDILGQEGVFAIKNGVRSMVRWDVDIPVIKKQRPGKYILTCEDEYLLHSSFMVDGMLVGYGTIAPELLYEMLQACNANDYVRAREINAQLLPLTKVVYHRPSHMEGTIALKHGLISRGILEHATVRTPLLPLPAGAHDEIHQAMKLAGII